MKTWLKQIICYPLRGVEQRIKTEFSLLLLLSMLMIATIGWQELTHNQLIGGLETRSATYLDETLRKAATAFLVARALNATISVLQSFTVTPFIGAISLGEVLDPINDLIESFSLVMLVVTVSIGIQKLLMEIGIAVNLTWVILPALAFILMSLFSINENIRRPLRLLAYRLLIFVLLIRFAIPITGFIGSHISTTFFAEKQNTALSAIETSKKKITDISLKEASTSPNESLERLQEHSRYIVEHIISLITLFILETILFPLLILWGLMKLFGLVFFIRRAN